jgi:hypothetical protein
MKGKTMRRLILFAVAVMVTLLAGSAVAGRLAAINGGGTVGDGQTTIICNPTTGELSVDAPASKELTSINFDSAACIFTGEPAQNLGGGFDNDSDCNIFPATFGESFGSRSFGNVVQAGLTCEFVKNDLMVVGSLAGGGDLGPVGGPCLPGPSTLILVALLGIVGLLHWRRR